MTMIAQRDQRTSDLLRLRAAGSPGPAFVLGATNAHLRWTDLVMYAMAWEDNEEDLSDGGRRCVGLLFDDPLATVACFLGALSSGVGVAPLNPGASPAELAAQCRALGVASLVTDLTDERLIGSLRAAGCDLWTVRGPELEPTFSATGRRPPLPPGRGALVLASSGTTGQPKIVALAEEQLLYAARCIASHHELSAADCGYCPLPLFHINALVVGVLSTLVAGSSLVVDRRFSQGAFWTTIARNEVTWLNLVPAIIATLANAPDGPTVAPARIRFARSASSPLAPKTLERFEQRFGISVLETYGMTEAASQITANPMSRDQRRAGSVGLPVGVDLRIVGTDRVPLRAALGRALRRHVRAPRHELHSEGLADLSHHLSDLAEPDQPEDVAGEQWQRTGDVGHVDADGFLYLAGRSDDVINRGGEKVYPREIEQVLLADDRVVSAVVIGRAHPTVGEEPVAFVLATVDQAERADLVAQLRRRCEAELSRYKRPVLITVADTLPIGPTGKIRRSAVRVLAGEARERTEPALDLPWRPSKPRASGLTMVIDGGIPSRMFEDAITSGSAFIDMVKFGWGTALVTRDLQRKIDCLHANGIRFCFGGTLFEKFVLQDRFESFLAFCHRFGCDFVEVSNGTIPMSNTAKAAFVRRCAFDFSVVSEVGFKDARRSDTLGPGAWIEAISEDLDAGAALVILEARESGRAGICHADGTVRAPLVDAILSSGVDPDRLVFEAPTRALQTESSASRPSASDCGRTR